MWTRLIHENTDFITIYVRQARYEPDKDSIEKNNIHMYNVSNNIDIEATKIILLFSRITTPKVQAF